MRKTIIILGLIIFVSGCVSRDKKSGLPEEKGILISSSVAQPANELFVLIRDNKIEKSIAVKMLTETISDIREAYYKAGGENYSEQEWVFPIKGYTPDAIGGKNGSSYVTGKYDFFDGNKHTGHTALDIFITDKNQDCLDDNTGKMAPILSASGGVVVAAETVWDTASDLRGGKYLWIYDPANDFLLYYAHNDSLHVQIGQIVTPGKLIATCGRTGLNAYKKRSPTHLHFMVLKLDRNMYPQPVNPYNFLLGSEISE